MPQPRRPRAGPAGRRRPGRPHGRDAPRASAPRSTRAASPAVRPRWRGPRRVAAAAADRLPAHRDGRLGVRRPAVPAAGPRRRDVRRAGPRRGRGQRGAAGHPRRDHRPQRRTPRGVARRADDRRRPDEDRRTTPPRSPRSSRSGSASTTSPTVQNLRWPDTHFRYIARRVPSTQADPGRARTSTTSATRASTPAATRCAATRPRTSRPTSSASSTPRARRPTAPSCCSTTLLGGKDGSATYDVGGGNRIPLGDNSTTEPVDGKDLTLTIDRDVQWYTQRVLRQTVEDAGGELGLGGRDGHRDRRAARAGRLPDVRPQRHHQRRRGRGSAPGRCATSTSRARSRRCSPCRR